MAGGGFGRIDDGEERMEARMDYRKTAPEGLAAFRNLQTYVDSCGLDHSPMELVKARASQINGCAYCLDMHTKNALAAGEAEQRLYALAAWRETPFFSDRERAALAWTEAVTQIAPERVDDQLYKQLQTYFSEKEIVDLTLVIIAINGWNRLAIPFRTPPGSYQPPRSGSKVTDPTD
jgi:AhpD family alkylhydroperoxidase